MTAYTNILGLYKPGGGSTGLITPDEVVDVDKINGNFDKIDAAVGILELPDASLPNSPYLNQVVHATTSDQLLRWNGSRWSNILPAYLQNLGSTYYTQGQLAGGALDGRYYTQSALQSGALDGRYVQQGSYVDVSSHYHVSSGWSVNRLVVNQLFGKILQIDCSVNRTGGSLSGNITNNQILSTDGGWGSRQYQGLPSGPGGNPNSFYVSGAGIFIAAVAPSTTINNGDEVTFAGLWIQS